MIISTIYAPLLFQGPLHRARHIALDHRSTLKLGHHRLYSLSDICQAALQRLFHGALNLVQADPVHLLCIGLEHLDLARLLGGQVVAAGALELGQAAERLVERLVDDGEEVDVGGWWGGGFGGVGDLGDEGLGGVSCVCVCVVGGGERYAADVEPREVC